MKKLFIPGPVNIEKEILNEMARPMIGHRTDEFKNLHKNIVKNTQKLLKTKNNVFLITCSATGAMEAAIRNTVNKDVLCLANGAFGRRWYDIAKLNNKKAKLIDFGDGKEYNIKKIEDELKNKNYEAVTVVLNDTATGIENNLEELKEILKKYPDIILLVDVVSGIFGTKIDFEGLDVVIFGTQKALALPPGLAIAIVDDKAIQKAEKVKNRGYYFDFLKIKKKAEDNVTLTTPNIPLMYALDKRLENIHFIGLDNWIEKHEKNANLVREYFTHIGFELFVDDKNKSNTVTVIENNKNIDVLGLINYMNEKGYLMANGYGELKNKAFRIGHMGVGINDTLRLLKNIDEYLQEA